MTTHIDVSSLTVHYGERGRAVVDGLNLVIEAGTFMAILGPSGCGKSTLLNSIAGFVFPTSGSVTFDGAPVTGPGPERGVVFQRDVLFPWASVGANIGFALRAAGVPRRLRREKIDALVHAVGLAPDVVGKRPHQLSGGMRQRVGIARALANNPRVLLMDEPFGALDALTRQQMQDLVVELWNRSQTTIIFVTHDVDEAIRIASSIVVMNESGAIADHITNPLPRPRPVSRLAEFDDYAALRRRLHDLLRATQPASTITMGDHL
ncbi:MAG TPA: ABC transporter ATP-binding protein [Mycobacterium sp.]|nr:ABC transporter ATP-binding protein [Mycobacterium sp.]